MQLKVQYLENYNKEWDRLSYKHAGDSGMDVRAAIIEPIIVQPMQRVLVPNGVILALDDGDNTAYEIQCRPRSGLAIKNGICLVNTPGTIDYGYRGELKTILVNLGNEEFVINPGDRIAQVVVCPIVRPQVVEVETIENDTTRGAGGFGSTGKG